MSDNNQVYTIFVGDLSIFCNESHIEEAFLPFGKVLSVRIAYDEEHQKTLPYGFVEYAHAQEATDAMKFMDGTILCGRKLRVKWATNKRKDGTEVKSTVWNDNNNTSSVHVIYLSHQCDKIITEESLRGLFSRYGDVQDVMIKKSTFSKEHNVQKGYGFVHFLNTPEGVKATLSAVEELFDSVVDNVNYNCSISHTYEKKLTRGAPVASADTAARISSYMGCVDSLRRFNSSSEASNSSSSGHTTPDQPITPVVSHHAHSLNATNNGPYRPAFVPLRQQQRPQSQSHMQNGNNAMSEMSMQGYNERSSGQMGITPEQRQIQQKYASNSQQARQQQRETQLQGAYYNNSGAYQHIVSGPAMMVHPAAPMNVFQSTSEGGVVWPQYAPMYFPTPAQPMMYGNQQQYVQMPDMPAHMQQQQQQQQQQYHQQHNPHLAVPHPPLINFGQMQQRAGDHRTQFQHNHHIQQSYMSR